MVYKDEDKLSIPVVNRERKSKEDVKKLRADELFEKIYIDILFELRFFNVYLDL